jgi:hypothetical protein
MNGKLADRGKKDLPGKGKKPFTKPKGVKVEEKKQTEKDAQRCICCGKKCPKSSESDDATSGSTDDCSTTEEEDESEELFDAFYTVFKREPSWNVKKKKCQRCGRKTIFIKEDTHWS